MQGASDIPSVLQTAKGVLEDLKSMEGSVETANDALDIDPDIINRLDTLAQETREEITGMTSTPKESCFCIPFFRDLVFT